MPITQDVMFCQCFQPQSKVYNPREATLEYLYNKGKFSMELVNHVPSLSRDSHELSRVWSKNLEYNSLDCSRGGLSLVRLAQFQITIQVKDLRAQL